MSILRFLLPLALLVVAGNATPEHDTLNIITKDDADAGYRLPTGIVPTAYDIHIETNLEDSSYTGVSKIDIRVDTETDTITLHAGENIEIQEGLTAIEMIKSEEPDDPETKKSVKKRSIMSMVAEKILPRGLPKLDASKEDIASVKNGEGEGDKGNTGKDEDHKGDSGKDEDHKGDSGKDDGGTGDSGKDEDHKGDSGKGDAGTGDGGKDDDGKGDDGKGDGGKDDDGKGDGGKDDDGKGDDGKGDGGKDDDGKGDGGKDDDGKGDDGKGDGGKDDDGKGDGGKDDDGKGDGGKDDGGKDDDGKGDDGKGDGGKDDDGKGDDGKGDGGKDDDGKGDGGKDDDGKGDDGKGDGGKDDDGKGDDGKGDGGKDDDGKGDDGGKDDPKEPPKVTKHQYDKDKSFLILKLSKKLNKQAYRLTLTYKSKLNEDKRGFFKTSYKTDDDKERILAATHFEPISARLAFPCWDEPALKAKFTISIKHPTDYAAVSNMPLAEKDDDAATKTSVTKFAVSPDMSTYLVAFVVSDYGNVTNDDGTFNVWTRKNALDHAHYAHDMGQKILDQFGEYTKIPYTLPKMDQISIPGLSAGAMENWGLVTYQEKALLYDEDSTTTQQQQAIANVIAHEFAHQWFGNLVSPKWWKYVWLNEGFATYFSYHAMDIIEPTWRMMDQFLANVMQSVAFVYDTVPEVRPMDYDVQAPKKVGQLFDSISYEKSGSVIRMMSHIVTPEVFKQGLRNYLKANSEKAASSDDLLKSIQKAVSASEDDDIKEIKIEPIMKSWITQRGYPVINVTRNYDDKKEKITVTQQRFYLSAPEKRDTHKFWVPLNYATGSKPDFNTTTATSWLKPTVKKVDITIKDLKEDEWVIFNLKQTGYYRVNYDEQNWNLIASYLDSDDFVKIDPANRAQIIDDALNLARAGLLDYGIALNVTQYLPRETDYIVWKAALRNLAFIEKMIAQSTEYETFQKFNAMFLANFLHTLPLEESDKDNHMDKMLRPQITKTACYYGVESCDKYTNTMFEDWLVDSAKHPLSVDMRDTVLCAGLRGANEEIWNKTVDSYKDKSAEEKKAIVAALGCAKHEETLWRYLNMVLDSKHPIKDAAGILNAVIEGSRLGVNLALDFIDENYEQLKKKMGGEAKLTPHFTKLGQKITTTAQYGKFALLLAQKSIPADVSSSGLKSAEENVAWASQRQPEIDFWLKTKTFEEPKEDEKKGPNGASTVSMAFVMLIVPLIATRFY